MPPHATPFNRQAGDQCFIRVELGPLPAMTDVGPDYHDHHSAPLNPRKEGTRASAWHHTLEPMKDDCLLASSRQAGNTMQRSLPPNPRKRRSARV